MIGVDIVNVNKMRNLIERWGSKFIDRVFSNLEQNYCEKRENKYQCYSVRFAAKESFYKAYNHPYGWKALEVITGKKPYIHILDEKLKDEMIGYEINISVSHIDNIGIALVILTHK